MKHKKIHDIKHLKSVWPYTTSRHLDQGLVLYVFGSILKFRYVNTLILSALVLYSV